MSAPSPELLELCGTVRDESATPAQIARLEVLLASDPEARRFYRRFTQISALLERYEQLAPAGEKESCPTRVATLNRRRSEPRVSPGWRTMTRLRHWLALAACFILAAIIFLGTERRPEGRATTQASESNGRDEAPVAYVQGAHASLLIPRVGSPTELTGSCDLRQGDIVVTGTTGSAVVRIRGENTMFVLSSDTRMWLAREGASKIMHLSSGHVYGDVAPQPDGRQWRILTAHGEARVLGTRLAVNAAPEGTHVAVTAGRVRVTARDTRQSVETAAGFAAQLTLTTATLIKLDPAQPTAVTSFTVVDADTNTPIPKFEHLIDGAVIDLAALPSGRLNIQANCEPKLVGMVYLQLTGVDRAGNPLTLVQPIANGFPNQMELFYPYMLAGDPSIEGQRLPHHSYPWMPQPGRYTLTATPYAGKKQWGARGQSLTVRFEIVGRAGPR